MGLPSNTPDILRSAGLKVKVHSGWLTRGRPGGLNPTGVLCHHTATGPNSSDSNVLNLLIRGRSDLAGPLCNLGLDRDGVVHIIAAGRANHAGRAKASGSMAAASSGNGVYIGIEAFNAGTGEKWNKKQYDAYVLLCAVLSVKITGNSVNTVRAHRETSVTGKIDPFGPTPYENSFDMNKFRSRVDEQIKKLKSGAARPTTPKPKVTSHTRWAKKVTGVYDKPNGKLLRNLAVGESFKVIDGSGAGKKGWIETTHHNWVRGSHTSKSNPTKTLSVMSWNVENTGEKDAEADVAEIKKILADKKPDVVCLQEAYNLYLAGIPGYKEVYHASTGYPKNSENRAQAILVRDGVKVLERNAIQMALSWVGPKMGVKKDPRVHRYVKVSKDGQTWYVSTWHVPFGANPVEETRKAAISWLKRFGALSPSIAVGDWNALANNLYNKVAKPAGAESDGGGKDRAVFKGCEKAKGENLGNRKRSDHDAKIWTWKK